jgi:hypothetical protein
MNKNNKIVFLISLIGFLILFVYFNFEKKGISDFFKSDKELFLSDFLPIEMKKQKYLGEIVDSSNHMYPYMNFGEVCMPMLDQWKSKIKVGDYVSKKKDSSTLLIERRGENYYLHFENKTIESPPSPCKCIKLSKTN